MMVMMVVVMMMMMMMMMMILMRMMRLKIMMIEKRVWAIRWVLKTVGLAPIHLENDP